MAKWIAEHESRPERDNPFGIDGNVLLAVGGVAAFVWWLKSHGNASGVGDALGRSVKNLSQGEGPWGQYPWSVVGIGPYSGMTPTCKPPYSSYSDRLQSILYRDPEFWCSLQKWKGGIQIGPWNLGANNPNVGDWTMFRNYMAALNMPDPGDPAPSEFYTYTAG